MHLQGAVASPQGSAGLEVPGCRGCGFAVGEVVLARQLSTWGAAGVTEDFNSASPLVPGDCSLWPLVVRRGGGGALMGLRTSPFAVAPTWPV